jgi:hyperosmotically inducible periplasmic protein
VSQAFIGKKPLLARILLERRDADFRIDMRNMPIAVSRLFVGLTLIAPLIAVTGGCGSTSQTTANAVNAANGGNAPVSATANDDASLAARVKTALAADAALRALPMSVATYRGMVQLSGYVDSADQIQRAIAVARGVPGVQSVNNDLYVRPR